MKQLLKDVGTMVLLLIITGFFAFAMSIAEDVNQWLIG